LYTSNVFVVVGCLFDYALHIAKIQSLRVDMIIHHIFALFIVAFLFQHAHLSSDTERKNQLIVDILSIEISTLFLSLNNIFKGSKGLCKKANQIAFVITFFYSRVYYYPVHVIFTRDVHVFLYNVSQGPIHTFYMFTGLYGLFAVNLYWAALIVEKMRTKNL